MSDHITAVFTETIHCAGRMEVSIAFKTMNYTVGANHLTVQDLTLEREELLVGCHDNMLIISPRGDGSDGARLTVLD